MSVYVQVRDYGAEIKVICTNCNINAQYDTYKKAVVQCKSHRLYHHPEQIDWTTW